MTRDELTEFFIEKTTEMIETMKKKNADYSGHDGEYAFNNFRNVEDLGIATTEQGFLTRMTDKLSRLSSLRECEAKVKEESVIDTCLDLANYSLLYAAYRQSKAQKQPKG